MGKAKTEKVRNPNKLGLGHLLVWKSSDITAAWINLLMLQYLSIYASDTLGVDIGVVGTLLLISKIIDAFTDLFAGWLVDNTHSKLGKGRPYELCIFGMTVCTVLLFACPAGWAEFAKCAWILSMYTLTFSIFATFRNAGLNAYTIRHFSNNEMVIRKVASFGGIITTAGSMIVSVAFPIMMKTIATSASGWTRAVLIIMVPGSLIACLRFFLCKEDPSVDAGSSQQPIRLREIFAMFRRNPYTWLYAIIMLSYNVTTNLAVGSYFFKWIIGDVSKMSITSVFGIVLLPLMLLFPTIMKKIGSMGKMVFYFSILGIVGYGICFLSGSFLPGVLAGFLLGTLSTLPVAYYGVLFIMDICTYNEMIGLPRMDGSAGILSGFTAKLGGALGAYLTGILLAAAGYISDPAATAQPDLALLMIRVVYALVPCFLVFIIGICCLAFSRLEKKASAFKESREADKAE